MIFDCNNIFLMIDNLYDILVECLQATLNFLIICVLDCLKICLFYNGFYDMLDLMRILVSLTVLLCDNVVLCCFTNCILFLAYVFVILSLSLLVWRICNF